MRHSITTAWAVLAASLTACGGGGGSGGTAPIQPATNLKALSFRLEHAKPTAGHETKAFTTISSDATVTDVVVGFYLLHKADYDADRSDIRQSLVDTAVYERVTAGTAEYEATIVLPASMPFDAGQNSSDDWLLVAEIDPANAIQETDENDNRPADGDQIVVTMFNENTPEADIVIEDVAVPADAIILWDDDSRPAIPTLNGPVTDEKNHDFSVTLEITTTGSAVVDDCDISATIVVPSWGSYELRFWNSETSNYDNELLTTITPGIPNSVHADLWFPGGLRRILGDELRNGAKPEFKVLFSSNMTAGVAEWEMGVQRIDERNDNQFETSIVIILPPGAGNGIDWTAQFKKDWSSRYFGIGMDLGAATSLDGRGAIAEGWGRIPVKLFGIASHALDASAYGRVKPVQGPDDESEFRQRVAVFGVDLVNEEHVNETYTDQTTYVQTKTYERRGVVFCGPVPIDMTARATGSYGYEITTFVNPAGYVQVDTVPFAQATAFASASVNVVVARFGVEGKMTLVDERLVISGSVDIGAVNPSTYTGTTNLSVYNVLTGPAGRLYLFAERQVIKWCQKIFPCGLRTKRNEKTLVRFKTFRKTDVLFNDTRTATVAY